VSWTSGRQVCERKPTPSCRWRRDRLRAHPEQGALSPLQRKRRAAREARFQVPANQPSPLLPAQGQGTRWRSAQALKLRGDATRLPLQARLAGPGRARSSGSRSPIWSPQNLALIVPTASEPAGTVRGPRSPSRGRTGLGQRTAAARASLQVPLRLKTAAQPLLLAEQGFQPCADSTAKDCTAQGPRLSRLRRGQHGPAREAFRASRVELKLSQPQRQRLAPSPRTWRRKRKGSGLVGFPRPSGICPAISPARAGAKGPRTGRKASWSPRLGLGGRRKSNQRSSSSLPFEDPCKFRHLPGGSCSD